MDIKVAVENGLNNVKEYFENQGCQVDTFSPGQIDTIGAVSHYDAIIISGMNENFLGQEDVKTKASIICTEGMTPEQVFNNVKRQHNSFQ